MSAFLAAALAYPTVFFTVMLGVFLVYATATLLGAAHIDWLDSLLGIDHLHGAHDVHDSVLESAMSLLGVAGVPVTIVAGVASIFGWLTSFFANRFLPDSLLINTGILAASGIIGLTAGSFALRPLRGVFRTVSGPSRKEHVGKICEVRSLRVDDHSGTADIGGMIADIRCYRENSLTVGSKAIVYDYDPQEGLYHVGPIDPSIASVEPLLTSRATQAEH
jgi:hypothetical protein